MSNFKTFEELDCWKKCRQVRIWIADFISAKVPKTDFDLIQNLRRASRSATRNIAEGFGRFHFKENAQFCRITRGSLFELKDDLITSVDEKLVQMEDVEVGLTLIDEALYSLNGYIRYLNEQSKNSKNY